MTNEEIIRGAYSAGKRRITCPVCNGGEGREEDTMQMWVRDNGVLVGYCHRASCCACIVPGHTYQAFPAPAFEPRPLRAPYRRVTGADYWGKEWLNRTSRSPIGPDADMIRANERGLRVLIDDPDTAVWRLRALDGTLVGHITRTKDKMIRTYKDLDRALYYWNGAGYYAEPLFIFEDPMSAALCSLDAVALLGTAMPDGLVQEIKARRPKSVLVCLDPGAEEAGMKVYTKLTMAGVPATFVPMSKDYKDMTLEERRELEETYA